MIKSGINSYTKLFLTYRLDFFIFRDNYFKNEEKQGYNTQVTETSSVSSSKIETEHITKTIEKSTISQNEVTSDNRLDDTDTFNALCGISNSKVENFLPSHTSALIDSLYPDCPSITVDAQEQDLR